MAKLGLFGYSLRFIGQFGCKLADGISFLDRAARLLERFPSKLVDGIGLLAALFDIFQPAISDAYPEFTCAHPRLLPRVAVFGLCLYILCLAMVHVIRPVIAILLRGSVIRYFDRNFPGRLEDYNKLGMSVGKEALENDPVIAPLSSRSHIAASVLKAISERSRPMEDWG